MGHAAAPESPALSAREVRLELDDPAALHGRLQIDGLTLRGGKFTLPLSPTNDLDLDDIQTELRFQANDTWSLDNFKAGFAGANLALSGDIAHASEIRHWAIFRGARTGDAAVMRAQLQKFSDTLGKIHFTGTPQLNLAVAGDARDVHSLAIHLWSMPPVCRHLGPVRATSSSPPGSPRRRTPRQILSLVVVVDEPSAVSVVWTARLARLKSEKLNADSVSCGGSWRAPELVLTNLSARLGGGALDGRAGLNVATRELAFTNSSSL